MARPGQKPSSNKTNYQSVPQVPVGQKQNSDEFNWQVDKLTNPSQNPGSFTGAIPADDEYTYPDFVQSGVINLSKAGSVVDGVGIGNGAHVVFTSDGSDVTDDGNFDFVIKDLPENGKKFSFRAEWRGLRFTAYLVKIGTGLIGQNWYVSLEGSDTNGDGSPDRPFETIQQAINAASDDDVINIRQGTYTGNITLSKNLTFKGVLGIGTVSSPGNVQLSPSVFEVDTSSDDVQLSLVDVNVSGVTTFNVVTGNSFNIWMLSSQLVIPNPIADVGTITNFNSVITSQQITLGTLRSVNSSLVFTDLILSNGIVSEQSRLAGTNITYNQDDQGFRLSNSSLFLQSDLTMPGASSVLTVENSIRVIDGTTSVGQIVEYLQAGGGGTGGGPGTFEFYVDLNYGGGSSDGSRQKPYTSITAAVAAAGNNYVIVLAGGNYAEAAITIDKSLAIVAQSRSTAVLTPFVIDRTGAGTFHFRMTNLIFLGTLTETGSTGNFSVYLDNVPWNNTGASTIQNLAATNGCNFSGSGITVTGEASIQDTIINNTTLVTGTALTRIQNSWIEPNITNNNGDIEVTNSYTNDLDAGSGNIRIKNSVTGTTTTTGTVTIENQSALTPQAPVEVILATGTYTIDQGSSFEKRFKTSVTISANADVDLQNGTDGSVNIWAVKVTGSVVLDFSGSTQSVIMDSTDTRWDNVLEQVTLDGDTDSDFEMSGYYNGSVWLVRFSDKYE